MYWHGERVSPEEYAAEAVKWRDRGARIIGGCCGTGPEHIAALKEALG
jgi:homocysteine S-methyltransferase